MNTIATAAERQPSAAIARVSLRQGGGLPSAADAPPLLSTDGPAVVLGGVAADAPLAEPLAPAADTLFGPRGVCAVGAALWVADTGHHRLLGWRARPERDRAGADWVVGQRDMRSEGRNASGAPRPWTVNVPTGVCAVGEGLAVADAWNHRVLIWRRAPEGDNVPADVVLGQPSGEVGEPNRGHDRARPDGLHWPYGVAWDGARLYVADAKNRRVLVWRGVPEHGDRPADLVLGQATLDGGADNRGEVPGASGMRWPHGICRWGDALAVSDAGNNRVMVWRQVPTADGAPCDLVLGQSDAAAVDHNQGRYLPTATALNMPYGLAAIGGTLLVADTASSRLVGWEGGPEAAFTGAAATRLTGQAHFGAKGDNGWRPTTRTSLCWPYAVAAAGRTALIADSGNNRVLLWDLA